MTTKKLIESKNVCFRLLNNSDKNLLLKWLADKIGFKIIKLLPKHELHNGKMVDCYLMECKKINTI